MAFVKSIRLKHAKEFLEAGAPGTSVTETAFKFGFSNLGHFAKDFRVMFGEIPSKFLATKPQDGVDRDR
jgi:transcriptional regulator GlxA family with amidase domain